MENTNLSTVQEEDNKYEKMEEQHEREDTAHPKSCEFYHISDKI